jgi:hypothetical protein
VPRILDMRAHVWSQRTSGDAGACSECAVRKSLTTAALPMQIALKSDYLSSAHCLLYGELPGSAQAEEWRSKVMQGAHLPSSVINAMEALPANAHPMSVVIAAVNAMGACHPEQNPALAGQNIYNSKAIQDAQIVRLLGAMPTIAAYAYYRCGGIMHGMTTACHCALAALTCCAAACGARSIALGSTTSLCRRLERRPTAANERLQYAENFLFMLDAHGNPEYKPRRARNELLHSRRPPSCILQG